ncbi:hypothetical protein IGI04_007442 [Brassica rapa subsp. trilocularis]|uniref:Uncharacterized protein n=1 Tax=Brassica rapa subsp. trilocularis TaxID=1813537 RepID=A0ABQ7NJR0_BRACM|nr:hypothetical protein IGI04_007442 [Brassica rapa subsp. trilocularis]
MANPQLLLSEMKAIMVRDDVTGQHKHLLSRYCGEVMGFKTTNNSELQSIQSFMVNIQLPQYVKASLLGNFG